MQINTNILQLSDMLAQDIIDQNNCYHIKAVINKNLESCNKCYQSNLSRNGTRVIVYRDIPIHGKQVGIYLTFQRYQCKNCLATLYQSSSSLDTNHLMTKRLVDYIVNKSYKTPFTEIALEVGIDEKTVRNVFSNNVDQKLKQLKIETPEVLGIDEVHLIGKPRGVITNIEQGTIVDMLKTRNKSVLMTYFSSLKNKENIRVVTMDMWRPYFDVISATIPHAKIVIDKFHVVKMATEAMEKVRKDIRKELAQRERIQLKNDRFLLFKRNHQLTPTEKLSMESWFVQHKLLGQAYALKESFYNIWNNRTKKEAEESYIEWSKQIPIALVDYFIPIVSTIDNWHKPIFNYFTARYTNNVTTEALNGLIKIMNRDGRGYSFEVLRAKMLLSNGMQNIHKYRKFNRIDDNKMMLPDFDKNYGTLIQKLTDYFVLESFKSTN
ncbi:MAG: ISL3 family transposase [Burkholderiales bacterium]|nr:ISL3 family transposase [Burkholderiales bacterium]